MYSANYMQTRKHHRLNSRIDSENPNALPSWPAETLLWCPGHGSSPAPSKANEILFWRIVQLLLESPPWHGETFHCSLVVAHCKQRTHGARSTHLIISSHSCTIGSSVLYRSPPSLDGLGGDTWTKTRQNEAMCVQGASLCRTELVKEGSGEGRYEMKSGKNFELPRSRVCWHCSPTPDTLQLHGWCFTGRKAVPSVSTIMYHQYSERFTHQIIWPYMSNLGSQPQSTRVQSPA